MLSLYVSLSPSDGGDEVWKFSCSKLLELNMKLECDTEKMFSN